MDETQTILGTMLGYFRYSLGRKRWMAIHNDVFFMVMGISRNFSFPWCSM